MYDQAHALLVQCGQRGGVDAVALVVAAGDVGDAAQALAVQIIGQQAGGGDAVHVIVAVDRDRFARVDRPAQPRDRAVHVAQQHRVVQGFDAAVKQARRILRLCHAAQAQNGGQQRRQAHAQQLFRRLRPVIRYFPQLFSHIRPILIIYLISHYIKKPQAIQYLPGKKARLFLFL